MPAHNWVTDADTGCQKNHFISNKLLVQSVAKLKIMPFTRVLEAGFKHQGEIVNVMNVKELPDPTTTQLEELTKIPIDKLQWGNRWIRVVEWGRGVEYTDLAQQLSKFDPESVLQKALTRQMQRALDIAAARNGFFHTDAKICFTPTSATGGTFATAGVAGATALSNLTFDHVGVLADYIAGDIHCPPFEGEDYIGLACRKTLRGLKSDSQWQLINEYLQKGDLFFRGEVGKMELFRWIQVDHANAVSNSTGASQSVLGEAVVFGDEAVSRVEVVPPQLYADPNYQGDFGRTHAIAWRGTFAFATTWNTATDGEAKIIKIISL